MNFGLTAERQMLQDSLRRFLRDRYPREVRDAARNSTSGFSTDIWRELADLGVIAALFEETAGGYGGTGGDLAVVFEELGRAGVVEPLLDTAVLAGGLIARLGTPEQLSCLDALMAGDLQLALAHGEPQSRYDLSRVETTAVEKAGTVVLNGRKSVVFNAQAADRLIVSVREAGSVTDEEGISLFLVPVTTKGVILQGYPLLAAGRAAEVVFEDVALPVGARLGRPGAGYAALEACTAAACVAQCAATLGNIETALELTRNYLMTRRQFGRPIGSFQALAHRVSDLCIEVEQARSAVINAAGHLHSARGARELYISAAKNLLARVGTQVAEETIQLHGGIGMTQEYELAHFARSIVMSQHRFGDEDHHLERFIAFADA
jgi:alkylation response protein AidB-like acyl-CoA dehydrogenase